MNLKTYIHDKRHSVLEYSPLTLYIMKILTLRSLCLSAALTLTSIATMAQEIPVVHVNVPDVTRLVEINTEGVNLRRLPNTTSFTFALGNKFKRIG